jgi:hypothetical protein
MVSLFVLNISKAVKTIVTTPETSLMSVGSGQGISVTSFHIV